MKVVEPEDTKKQHKLRNSLGWTQESTHSQRVINEWNELSNDCVNASGVNMLKNKIYKSQWLPCPLTI